MLEQLYKLNFPTFDEVKKCNIHFQDNNNTYSYLNDFNFNDYIDLDKIKFLDFKWKSYRYFKKSKNSGSIHSDATWDIEIYPKKCVWGINWVFGGDGKIDFWETKSTKQIGFTRGADNNSNLGIAPKFIPLKMADYSYDTLKDNVYLVNATLPHKATGNLNRQVFSLRTDLFDIPWEDIIKIFSKYII